jgi:YD repeat-containing protein
VKEIRPEGLETEYRYDGAGNLAAVSDNGGRVRELSYDICHNLILRREKVSEGEWAQERFTWDAMGRLTGEEDGEGHLTRYCYEGMSAYPCRTVYADGGELLCGYDRLGRRLWEEDAAGRREYAYNRNGWQTMERDGEGNETHRLYDGAGRMTALYSPAQWQAGNGKRTEYRYDFLDRLEETIHSDGSHEKQFLDGEGNILKKVHPNAYDQKTGDGEGTCYEYDTDGHLLRTVYPDGGVERSFYDGEGRLVKHVCGCPVPGHGLRCRPSPAGPFRQSLPHNGPACRLLRHGPQGSPLPYRHLLRFLDGGGGHHPEPSACCRRRRTVLL